MSIPFLSSIVPIFARNVPLIVLLFLKTSLVFPFLIFPSIFLHSSLKKTFSSPLVILWNSHGSLNLPESHSLPWLKKVHGAPGPSRTIKIVRYSQAGRGIVGMIFK